MSVSYGKGRNFNRDFEKITGTFGAKLREGWNATYSFTKFWLKPDPEYENSWIQFVRTTYYVDKDFYFKLFYQTKYNTSRGFFDPQFVFVWRFLPPFGSIQLAYQEGTTRVTDIEGQERTFFTKLSWVLYIYYHLKFVGCTLSE